METAQLYSKDELKTLIRQIVAEIAEMELSELKDNMNFFEELEMDSMMALEILAIIEKKLDIEIEEQYLEDMTSIENVLKVIETVLQ